MRTKLRSKFTLLLIVCAVLIAVPGAAALAQDTSSPAAPTIQSDKDLYTPGELVTLTGSGWLAGEKVNIFVNDNQGNTWSRNVDVYADASGNISDSFNLPDWFVAVYTVKATGASGAVATTSFSDPTLTVKRGPEGDPPNLKFTVNWQRYTNNTCTTLASGGNTTGSRTIDTDAGNNLQAGTGNVPPGSGGFVKITAPQTPTSPSGYTFDKWETISGTTLDTTNTSADGLAICVRNPGGALNDSYRATYKVSDTTAPVVTLDKVNGTTRTFPYSTNQNVTSVGGSCTNGDGDVSVTLDGNAANPATASCSSGSWSLTLTNALSNEGTYTFSASQTDAASNPGSSGTKPVQIDKTAPNVQCESADADWHANNVSIDCTANDGGSGLNLASDANFSLSTTVAAGNETNNASTGTKDLTDAVGNSATAGPISGNKVDKKAPPS